MLAAVCRPAPCTPPPPCFSPSLPSAGAAQHHDSQQLPFELVALEAALKEVVNQAGMQVRRRVGGGVCVGGGGVGGGGAGRRGGGGGAQSDAVRRSLGRQQAGRKRAGSVQADCIRCSAAAVSPAHVLPHRNQLTPPQNRCSGERAGGGGAACPGCPHQIGVHGQP